MLAKLLTRRSRQFRRGTTAVEAAFVLPVFLVFVFGLVGYGHAQMVSNLLKSACRNAARYGAAEGVTTEQTVARVKSLMGAAINSNHVTVIVKDGSVFDTGGTLPTTNAEFNSLPDLNVQDAEPRQMFLVRATVPYSNVCVLNLSYLSGITLVGQSITRHE